MKNIISYYYGLITSEFKKANDKFIFKANNVNYEFTVFNGEIETFYKVYMIVKNSSNYCHEIVLNRNNSIYTYYRNKIYILLKKVFSVSGKVNLKEIINYTIPTDVFGELNWKELWKEKIDYYEYQMSQMSFKYHNIKESFNYYVGLAENAISLLNYINNSKIEYYICHKRISIDEKLEDFVSPINLTLDTRVRDISEYIKINYINGKLSLENTIKIVKGLNFNCYEIVLLFSRFLYPSYYFDIYDQIIQGQVSEEKINYYIKKNTMYEVFLKTVYKFLQNKYIVPEIEWLKS